MTKVLPAPSESVVNTPSEKVRILVVDDSLLYRKVIREALAAFPNVEVVGSAGNGKAAIEQIEQLRPDMITLDFEMPELDGRGVLRWMKQHHCPAKAVMISSLTSEGAEATLQALQEGAFDFVVKPSSGDLEQNKQQLATALKAHVGAVESLLRRQRTRRPDPNSASTVAANPDHPAVAHARVRPGQRRIALIGIGVSTGGPDALRTMLPMLPANLPVPVVIVQHMPPVFTKSLAQSLDRLCKLRVSEGTNGQLIRPGQIVIAPGGHQLKIVRDAAGTAQVVLTDDPPVQSCRPAVDYLFNSLAEAYGAQTLSVIMTGMGNDGAEGCRRLHQLGGPVIAQDEATCVVFGMPRKLVEEGIADVVAPLNSIAQEIVTYTQRHPRA